MQRTNPLSLTNGLALAPSAVLARKGRTIPRGRRPTTRRPPTRPAAAPAARKISRTRSTTTSNGSATTRRATITFAPRPLGTTVRSAPPVSDRCARVWPEHTPHPRDHTTRAAFASSRVRHLPGNRKRRRGAGAGVERESILVEADALDSPAQAARRSVINSLSHSSQPAGRAACSAR